MRRTKQIYSGNGKDIWLHAALEKVASVENGRSERDAKLTHFRNVNFAGALLTLQSVRCSVDV